MSSVFKLPKVGLEAIKKKKVAFAKELAAELLGTMLLVMIGCGSAMSGDGEDGEGQMSEQVQYVRIALAFGLAVATIAQTVGHISGCHINPAITVGLVAGAKVEVIRGLAYVVAQSLGGLLGAALLNSLVPDNTRGQSGLGSTQLGNGVSLAQGFGIEFFISLVLVLVVFGAAADENNAAYVKGSAPLAIGLSITACHLFAIPLTGASMNPARTLGSNVVAGKFEDLWLYLLAPTLGGLVAGLLYQGMFAAPSPIGDDSASVVRKKVSKVLQKDQKDLESQKPTK